MRSEQNTTDTKLPGADASFALSRMGFASLGTVPLTGSSLLYQVKKRRQYYGERKDGK